MDVEHVLDKRPLELGTLAEDDGEARAGEFHAAREVKDAELLADCHVVENLEVRVFPLAYEAHHLVVGRIHAGGDFGGGDVWNHEQGLAKVVLHRGEFLVDFGDSIAHLAHFLLGGREIAAFLGDFADFLGGCIALRLQRLGFAHESAALGIQIPRLLATLLFDATPCQCSSCCIEIVSQLLDVYHSILPSFYSRQP